MHRCLLTGSVEFVSSENALPVLKRKHYIEESEFQKMKREFESSGEFLDFFLEIEDSPIGKMESNKEVLNKLLN